MRVAHVDCGDIHSISFDNIHQVVRCGVRLSNRDIGICYPILAQNGLDFVVVGIGKRHGVRNGYAPFILPPNDDRRGLLIQSDPKAFEFGLDYLLVAEGFEYVQDDED